MPPNSDSVWSAISLADVGVGHVDRNADRGAAVGHDLLGDLLRALDVDVGDDDRRALTGQRLGVRLADAATGSGDDRRPCSRTAHVFPRCDYARFRSCVPLSHCAAVAMALISRYSSKPARPISRPMPDCL